MSTYPMMGPLDSGRLLDSLRSTEPPPADLLARASTLSRDLEWRASLLRTAATNDQHEALESLISQGFDPMHDGGLSLALAADRRNHRCVEVLLKAGVPALAMEGEAFACAASSGSVESFDALEVFAESVSADLYRICLNAALGRGRAELVRRILSRSFERSHDDWGNFSRSALLSGGKTTIEMLELLLAHQLSKTWIDNAVLPAAAFDGDRDVVVWALARNPDLSADRYAAICCAANGNDPEMLTLVSAAMMRSGALTHGTIEEMRRKGMESTATMVELEADTQGYHWPDA